MLRSYPPARGRAMEGPAYPSLSSALIPGNSASTRRTVVSSSGLVATAAHLTQRFRVEMPNRQVVDHVTAPGVSP